MMPNPSVKGDAQQRATQPAWGASHLTPSGRRVTLPVAPYLKRYAGDANFDAALYNNSSHDRIVS
jgi:hypothetical protein